MRSSQSRQRLLSSAGLRCERLEDRVVPAFGFPALASIDVNNAAAGNGASNADASTLSTDGRYLVFQSTATNLASGIVDNNGQTDIFRRDLITGTTQLVSVRSAGGAPGNGESIEPALSADGRHVAFRSNSTNLAANAFNGLAQIYVRDMLTGVTVCASVGAGGAQGNGNSYLPRLSANGRRVVFQSDATNLVAGDGNAASDVFCRDLDAGTTTLVSAVAGGGSGNGPSGGVGQYHITPDGAAVVFVSSAANLVVGVADGNGAPDVFVRRLQTALTLPASVAVGGASTGNGPCSMPSISADGNRVAFLSGASNLTATDGNGAIDLFVRDLGAHTTVAASVRLAGDDTATLGATAGFIFPDGLHACFASASTDIGGSTNGFSQIYARDLDSALTTLVSANAAQSNGGAGASYLLANAGISAAGDRLAYSSDAPDLVAADGNGLMDVFVRDLGTNATSMVSRSTAGASNGASSFAQISADGSTVAFGSVATNLSSALDNNSVDDLFWAQAVVEPPAVANVWFDGTAWTPEFRAAAGDASRGYPAQTGANQLLALPWNGIDRVRIQFTKDVLVDANDLSIRGLNVATYLPIGFAYDSAAFVATWTITPLSTDRLLFDLDGDGPNAVRDAQGSLLAGTWTEGSDSFPTAGAAGVDFRYRVNVLVGDANRSGGPVSNLDLNAVRNQLFFDTATAGYDIFRDVDGSGAIRNADLNGVRNNLFMDLPPGEPAAPRRSRGRVVGEAVAQADDPLRRAANASSSRRRQVVAALDALFSAR